MDELTILEAQLAERELARRSYADYLPYVHGEHWRRTRMSEHLAYRVQRFLEADTGNAYDIMIIQTPPQHGKSMTISETLPSWYQGKNPRHRIILASYNDTTAERFNRRNKEKVLSCGPALFGVTVGAISRSTEYELDNGVGSLISRGILSGITGNPANLMIIDDPIKNRQEADSPTIRERLWEEWQNTLKSRLAAKAKVIVIATPWHEDDLMARILASEANVELVRLPVEAGDNDPLGRRPGDPLCPELGKNAAWLEQFRASYISDPLGGARAWQALYMCNPRVEGGNLVHRSWWRYYDPKEITTFASELISVDATFKDGDDNDYVAITVWGKRGNDYFLRYVLRKHLNFPGTVAAIRTVRRLYPRARTVLIEDKANGSAIIQTLQAEMFCIPVNPKGGKVARVNAVSPAIESGHVHIPNDAPWTEEYIDEWSAFPAGAHDDMVDSSSQALSYMLRLTGVVDMPPPSEVRQMAQREVEAFNDPAQLYDPYGVDRGDLL